MEWVNDLITNPYLLTGLASWGIAQVLKTVIHAFINKKSTGSGSSATAGCPAGTLRR